MTFVGHTLVGATIGAMMPLPKTGKISRSAFILAVVVCANLPDLPLPGWGHSNYRVSHSIFVGIVLISCGVILLRGLQVARNTVGSWLVVLAGSMALVSHYFLDSIYNHGMGIAVFWPLSDARIVFPISWFSIMKSDPFFCWHNVKVWSIELLFCGAFFAVCYALLLLCEKLRNGSKKV